jgi:general secretion pathway protein D
MTARSHAEFRLRHTLLALSALTALATALPAAQNTVSGPIADTERAAVRSQESLRRAQSMMKDARELSASGKLREAFEEAASAIELAPSGKSAAGVRNALVSDYTAIALSYARQLVRDGVFTDTVAAANGVTDSKGQPLSVESVAKSVLVTSVNPGCVAAKQLLSDLEQPAVFNKTVTPKFAAQRDEVARLLTEAEGLAASGRNDLALRRYESVLTIDPYNAAARKGMEGINNSKIKYFDEAYNETRARMLWQVEKAWERTPRKEKQGRIAESSGRQQDIRGTDQILEKLNSIVIDRVDLSDSPISEAVEYLKQKSVSQDPAKRGVNIILKLGSAAPSPVASATPAQPGAQAQTITAPATPATPAAEPHVSLSLNHVPLYVALDYVAKLAEMKLKIDPFAVAVVPLNENTENLITKEYQVPPTFIPPKASEANNGGLPQPGFSGGVPDPNKARVTQRMDAKEYLQSQGVSFPTGSSANYLSAGSKLVVRNTRDNIDVIDSLVDAAMGVAPSQVEIQTKFLEINQNNLQELGFDWLLGPFSVGGGVYGSGGGVPGTGSSSYPFGNPMVGGAPMSPVGGLRSGDQAISGNSVDSLLAGQYGAAAAPAPGIFSIAGVFSDPQFQLVVRALNQKKGIDLMSAPKVTTKSGSKAVVKIVNEFIYPRQYQPPQIPQSTSNTGVVPPTVTPSFPTDFTKQDLGVTLDAKPTIGPDGYTIDLELHPQVIDFDGFINYGSPINAVGYQRTVGTAFTLWNPIVQTLTTNTINQPVFSTREVNTFVTVWDGQTVALGGLIREDVQKVQDKVPFLGDVPLAGRLFRSEIDQKLKKNLIIFVTPRILDAEGQPRRGEVEEPEVVTPLGLPQDLPLPTNSISRGK